MRIPGSAICLLLSALLLIMAIGSWPAFAAGQAKPPAAKRYGKTVGAGVSKSGRLSLESIGFYYRTDEETRYIDLKTQHQAKTRGELPPDKAAELAREAFEKSSVEKPFTQWLYHGGPNPNVFLVKAHLYNQSDDARLNVTLTTTLRAKVGEKLVNPRLLLTDFSHLQKTARWETVSQERMSVPPLAPGEELQVVVGRMELLKFLNEHPNHWPTEIEARVTCSEAGQSKTTTLILTPDHFVVPQVY